MDFSKLVASSPVLTGFVVLVFCVVFMVALVFIVKQLLKNINAKRIKMNSDVEYLIKNAVTEDYLKKEIAKFRTETDKAISSVKSELTIRIENLQKETSEIKGSIKEISSDIKELLKKIK